MSRFRCRLLGCCEHENYPACERCGAARYDPEFIDRGWLWPAFDAWWRLRSWAWPRCWHCNRRLWRSRVSDNFCSQECFDRWIPF